MTFPVSCLEFVDKTEGVVVSDIEVSSKLVLGTLNINLKNISEMKKIVSRSTMVEEALCKVMALIGKGNEHATVEEQSRVSSEITIS